MSGSINIDVSGNIMVPDNGVTVLETVVGSFTTVNITVDPGVSIVVGGDGVQVGETVSDPTSTAVITLDNSGLIETTGTGQALDFSQLISPAENITITNEATGTIQSADADAILTGESETIDNFGKIAALSITSAHNDGIDFKDTVNGVVNNAAGASIAGAEHGITGSQPITVVNAGAITGYAGSGIDMETASATTTTIDNSGAIIGNSVSGGPSGDAINVDGLILLNNSGLIEANGTSNPAVAAVSVGGGEIDNQVGGTITSSEVAISVDGGGAADGTGLSAFAPVTIDNNGTIQGDNGEAIAIFGNFDDTITNIGAIIGSVSTGGGDDVINLYTGSSITGLLDGGAGNDTVNLLGSGVGDLASFANIETINLNGGDWTLGSEGINDLVFAPGTETLRLTPGVLADGTFSGTISHFAPGDVIDLEGIGLATGVSLGSGNLLTISGAPGGPITLQLDAADDFVRDVFQVATDNAGGTLLTLGEVVNGGNGGLVLNGSPGSDIINAGNGSDTINGGGGNDLISAGNGNDTINEGDGNDVISAGNGNDTINGGSGNDIIKAGNGNDTISAGPDSVITAGNGDDTVTAGADSTITLGHGNDTINADANSTITVDHGQDTFVFKASDPNVGIGTETVYNFSPQHDVIEVDQTLVAQISTLLNDAHQVGADTIITIDPHDVIDLKGVAVTSLHASDFHLL